MTFYVKYPPEGDERVLPPKVEVTRWANGDYSPAEWEPCTIGIEQEYYSAVRGIESCKWNLEATGNHLYLLEAFRLAAEAKLYPPLWAIERLNERFAMSMKQDLTLDRAFGFSAEGLGKGGRTDAKTSDRLRNRNWKLCLMVFKLEAAGLSRPQACRALSKRLARLGDGDTLGVGERAIGRMDISKDGLEKAVDESAGEWSAERDATFAAAKDWTLEDRCSHLSAFDRTELPPAIVRALGL